jgi:GDP-4-dehydro-6-deoxy-D-mannose reductase
LDIERDFLDVRDMARACGEILERVTRELEVFNVASGLAVSLHKIVRILLANTDCKISLHQETSRGTAGGPDSIRLDTKRLREATGWVPEIPIERSVLDTLNHWRSVVNK